LFGVVPVSATNLRANVRSDMTASFAIDATVWLSAIVSSTRSSTGSRLSELHSGIGSSTNCR
jgi:hypothetical protein